MIMTNKFLLYDLNQGGFITADGSVADNDLSNGAMFSKESAEKLVNQVTEESFLQVPLTQSFEDNLPFDLADTAPDVAQSESMDRTAAMKDDFVVLTEYGFYDEKYNSTTNSSRPKVRGFGLDYANLYSMDKLQELGTEWITKAEDENMADPIIVPITQDQQVKLQQLPAFSPEKEPYGFFMEPIGDTQRVEATDMPDLGSALDALEAEQTAGMEMPF